MPEHTVLLLPGWQNSGPGHWQTLWEQANPHFRRVQQRDWNRPQLHEWIDTVEAAVASAPSPVVFVAHSLGCLTVARWAKQGESRVAGALLVAPPDLEQPGTPQEIQGFTPPPDHALPFPSILVGSHDDPYCTLERAALLARQWGSTLHDAGHAGHINVTSGHGPWPDGERLLRALLAGHARR